MWRKLLAIIKNNPVIKFLLPIIIGIGVYESAYQMGLSYLSPIPAAAALIGAWHFLWYDEIEEENKG